jgi:hypothetical protein
MVELDEDHNALFKIADKNVQVIKIEVSNSKTSKIFDYYLTSLTLESEE